MLASFGQIELKLLEIRQYSCVVFVQFASKSDCAIQALDLISVSFISPIVDKEKLITDMMAWANVTEDELKKQGVIHTGFGEDLSWEYLCYVRSHPIHWDCPTAILYGSRDDLTSYDTIKAFVEKHQADLTIMENGDHWFHKEEQMKFLDSWIEGELK